MNSADRDSMERAYAVGNHAQARAAALALAGTPSEDPGVQARARQIVEGTAADWFLPAVGLVGLGLTVWLVYKYVL